MEKSTKNAEDKPINITSSQIRQYNGTVGLLYNNEGYYDYGGEKQLMWSHDAVKELIKQWLMQKKNRK